MGNMSYCRFQNTDHDLADCQDVLNSLFNRAEEPLEREEFSAAQNLLVRCRAILDRVAEFLEKDPAEMMTMPEEHLMAAIETANELALPEEHDGECRSKTGEYCGCQGCRDLYPEVRK